MYYSKLGNYCQMEPTDKSLTLSPLDGRYYDKVSELSYYLSEFALNKQRILIESEYLKALSEHHIIRVFSKQETIILDSLSGKFYSHESGILKKYELRTKHDIKAVEYYLQEKLKSTSLVDVMRYIHFGLTSEDVNNLAYSSLLQTVNTECIVTLLDEILFEVKNIAVRYKYIPFLARTHGQPAVPTTFGKEMYVFYNRLRNVKSLIQVYSFEGKLNGAVGNHNALVLLYPKVKWVQFSKRFISSFKLKPCLVSTQILPSDSYVLYFTYLHLLNSILISLCQDIWTYISQNILILRKEKGQVGSSTMPQKINPIDFENAEGNLQIANSLFNLYANKLPISRLQRDLSDSTVKRSFATALGHNILAWKNIIKGLHKISLNEKVVSEQLFTHYEILAEALQLYLKDKGDNEGYEKIKKEFQGRIITKIEFQHMLDEYKIDLKNLSPYTYTGIAAELVKSFH